MVLFVLPPQRQSVGQFAKDLAVERRLGAVVERKLLGRFLVLLLVTWLAARVGPYVFWILTRHSRL